jgi:hypothetical protein
MSRVEGGRDVSLIAKSSTRKKSSRNRHKTRGTIGTV